MCRTISPRALSLKLKVNKVGRHGQHQRHKNQQSQTLLAFEHGALREQSYQSL